MQDLLPLDTGLTVTPIDSKTAREVAEREHYLHRKPSVSYAYGLHDHGQLVGIVTFGVPASRHLQQSVCPTSPDLVIELNRLWVHDRMPTNTESWFVSRAMKLLPARIVVSYADTAHGHLGYIYRALNFRYAGWTDMDRKTPRFDYIPIKLGAHSRDAFRNGYTHRVPRKPKVKYWTVTGNRIDRRRLTALCGWTSLDWKTLPPPTEAQPQIELTCPVRLTKKTQRYWDITRVLLGRLSETLSVPVKRRDLAVEFEVSDDTVSRAIKWAVTHNLLTWTPPQIPGGPWSITPPQQRTVHGEPAEAEDVSTPPQIASVQVNPSAHSDETPVSPPPQIHNDWDRVRTWYLSAALAGHLYAEPPGHHRGDGCADDCWTVHRWRTQTGRSYERAA